MAKKTNTPEELNVEEFMKLEEAPDGVRKRKVDYKVVLDEILGRALSVRAIANIMKAHATDKKEVYYSEVTGFLQRLAKKPEYKVERRIGAVVYYCVTRVGIKVALKDEKDKKGKKEEAPQEEIEIDEIGEE